MQETWVQSLGWEESLEEGMATHPVFLPGESLWSEEPGGLRPMESRRAGHDWSNLTCTHHFLKAGETYPAYNTRASNQALSSRQGLTAWCTRAQLCLTSGPYGPARQAPLSMGFSRQEARILEWVAISFSYKSNGDPSLFLCIPQTWNAFHIFSSWGENTLT